ncbi:Ribonuclease H-like domain containing protein [Trema orientale]|uniref:Ribonuclease H-like domain containing protein n=1 Tax=Trema orientale TaxID=63057 RepID=A0A2P5DH24_TREOI|nr:Ribonuclease H-like domain containing protein [Trema orientale]
MVVGAFTTRFRGRFSPFIAECIAVREGLKFAMEEGVMVNIVETDCLNIISAIHSRSSLSIESSIIEDIVVILSWLDNVSCSHIPRSENEAAHSLARFALFASCITTVWKNEIPECISNVVLNNLPI